MIFSVKELMQIVERNFTEPVHPALRGHPALGTDKKIHDLFNLILGEYNDLKTGGHLIRNKLIDLKQRQYLQQFKNWQMPEQSSGYIKARRHDFL